MHLKANIHLDLDILMEADGHRCSAHTHKCIILSMQVCMFYTYTHFLRDSISMYYSDTLYEWEGSI